MAEITIANDRATLWDRMRSSWDGWFNPGKPIASTAPSDTQPRQFDYTQSQNLSWMPRAYEPIDFQRLRLFADNCYLIRVIIEKMKDRICAKDWHFRLKPMPGEYQAQTKDRSNKDPRVAQLTNFFARPDSTHPWKKWLRMLLEDRLVIDAAALEIQRTKDRRIFNLLPLDGATISRTIDVTGRTPRAPLPAYRQIIKGLPEVDFTVEELLYMPANVRTHKMYGYSPVEQTIQLMVLFINKTVFDLDFYSDSNLPLAQFPIPENTSANEAIRLMKEIDSRLAGNLAERSKILPTFGNGKIEVLKREPFDVKFEEWAARVFCFVVGETPTNFVQQNNRATANQADDTREESGEQPMMGWVKDEIDDMVQRPDVFNAPDIEFVWDEQSETDQLKQAQIDQIQVSIRTRTPNELRQRDGLSPVDGGDEFPSAPQPGDGKQAPDDGKEGEDGESGPGAKRTPPPPVGGKAAKAASGEGEKKTLKIDPGAFTPARRSATDKIDAALKAFFFTQRHAVGVVIGKHLGTATKAAGDHPDPEDILKEIDWDAWNSIPGLISPALGDTTRDAVAQVFATLNMSQEGNFFDLADTFALEYAQTRAAEMVGKKWIDGVLVDNPSAKWAITDTTRAGLRDLIAKAFAENWSPAELAQQIDSAFMFSADRAAMIAETETAMALTAATVNTGVQAGATTKSVQMSNDHDIDDECDDAEQAGEVPIDEAFPDGSMHVPLHPRCQCVELLHIPNGAKVPDQE